jgi:ATP-binding cassette subfamily B multidrug efflux pump
MRASLWRLQPVISKHKFRLVTGIIAFGVARFFESMVPFLTAVSINRIVADDYDLTGPVAGIIGAVFCRYFVVTFARFQVRKTALNVAFDLRQHLYASLQEQGGDFFGKHSIGDMMTRAIADIALVQRLIAMGTILVVILVYAGVFGFAFMLYYSPTLTLLLLPPMPFVFWYARYSSRLTGIASLDVQNRLSDLGTHVQENLSGIRTIQAMVQEEHEIKKFAATNQAYADAFYEQGRINSEMAAWMPTLAAACSLTILGYGGHLVVEGEILVGDFVAFFMFVNMVVQPFRVAGFIVNLFQRAAVASDRLYEVIDLEPEIPDAPSGLTPEYIGGAVEFHNLNYTYPGTKAQVLINIDLSIQRGETIAIMGRVGSGKTTLLKQLVRLIDPAPGEVKVDGHDVLEYPLAQIRAQLAMVPQDPFLFAEPLRDNLTYDNPNRTLDLIWQAATSADLRNTIEDFPLQLDTLVGERGVTLSGGQKQRATLARGMIRNAPVLILDDCFSSVDTETEEHILSELRRLRSGQTTIMVSHRVSTARHADRILVLDEGKIIEMGSHQDLITAGGYYAELERVQREGADNENLADIRLADMGPTDIGPTDIGQGDS